MNKHTVFQFTNFEDVIGYIEGPLVRSVSTADRALRKYRIVSAAGDYGAMNLYKNDAGKWRCEFQRHQMQIDSKEYATKREALRWFKNWLPCLDTFGDQLS